MYFFGVIAFLYFTGENNPDCEACQVYYPNLQTSIVTSVGVATLNDFSTVAKDMAKEITFNPVFTYTIFFLYGVTTQFVIFNCITAIIVDIILSPDIAVPSNASSSFWNRAFMGLFLELFSSIMTPQERVAMEEKTTLDKFKSLGYIVKRRVSSIFNRDGNQLDDTKLYGELNDEPSEKSDSETLRELLSLVKTLDRRITDMDIRLYNMEKKLQ
jgi:hypothetical protein